MKWLLSWVSIFSVTERYRIELASGVAKDLKKLRHAGAEAARALKRLEENPEAGHALLGDLQGYRSLEFNLKGSGDCRAIYRVDEAERLILVFMIGPHENFYDRAKRRLKG